MSLIRRAVAPDTIEGICHWFVFAGNDIVVPVSEQNVVPLILLPYEKPSFSIAAEEYLGSDGEVHYFAADTDESFENNELFYTANLRLSYKTMAYELFRIAGYASEVIHWTRNFRFCGRCGTATVRLTKERAMRCPSCELTSFPRLSPAVIVVITKGQKILLAHNSNFPENLYSTLAGFIDPGESAEEAVAREVMEEVGISVKNIRYYASQPWPFPDSLMLGYIAEYSQGDITPDMDEITDARWFSEAELEGIEIPSKQAVARTLIEAVFGSLDRD